MKILVKRLKAIGDILLATSVLPYLRKQYPDAEINFSTGVPVLLEENPYVDKIISVEVDSKQYDRVFDLDLAYELNPKLSIFESYARIVGCQASDLALDLKIPQKYFEEAKAILDKMGLSQAKNLVAIQSAGAFWVKNWAPRNFERLVKDLNHIKFIHLGTKLDPHIRGTVDLRGEADIMTSAAIMTHCKAFFGLDTSLLHFAKAFNLPVAALFGSSDPHKRIKVSPSDLIITSRIDCRFCNHRHRPPAFITICERENFVFRGIDTLFQRSIWLSRGGNPFYSSLRYALKALFYWREKGRLIAPCMKEISCEEVLEKTSRWITEIIK